MSYTPPGSEVSPADEVCSVTQRTIVLHDSGDVTLLIGTGEEQQAVLVSIAVLRLASPVWKAMYSGSWAESNTNEVKFPEDDVDTLLLVLRIAHLQFQDLPRKRGLSLRSLYKLAVVCDKYDLVKMVRPFLDLYEWALAFHYTTNSHQREYSPDWLFVAWTFGYTESFDALARRLALTVTTDEEGFVYDEYNEGPVLDEVLPPDILESIAKVREDTLSSMLTKCYDTLDKVLSADICSVIDDSGNCIDEEKCRTMIYGSLVRQLTELDLYPEEKTGADVHFSVSGLQDMLVDIHVEVHESYDVLKIATYMSTNRYCTPNNEAFFKSQAGKNSLLYHGFRRHEECGKVFNHQSITTIVSSMPTPMLDSHRRHMSVQAKK